MNLHRRRCEAERKGDAGRGPGGRGYQGGGEGVGGMEAARTFSGSSGFSYRRSHIVSDAPSSRPSRPPSRPPPPRLRLQAARSGQEAGITRDTPRRQIDGLCRTGADPPGINELANDVTPLFSRPAAGPPHPRGFAGKRRVNFPPVGCNARSATASETTIASSRTCGRLKMKIIQEVPRKTRCRPFARKLNV